MSSDVEPKSSPFLFPRQKPKGPLLRQIDHRDQLKQVQQFPLPEEMESCAVDMYECAQFDRQLTNRGLRLLDRPIS
jgi:hypothetical protein